MSLPKFDFKSLPAQATQWVQKVRPYSFVAFVAFVALIYGFVIFKINNLRSQEPSSTAVTSQVKAAQIPHVDPEIVKQLESLQDNSVSVKSLFDQARSNPFQ
jgi:hypothetical protein